MQPSREVKVLLEIMAALRQPETGCPWDVEQTFETIKPYTIEEAYEVADAIERGDCDDLCDELGDLLLQVVFHARMAEEEDAFDFGEVVRSITAKMIRRHPHVFADRGADTADAVKANWEEIKAAEKLERAERRAARGLPDDTAQSYLDGIPRNLPALSEALKLQARAAKVGFDWSDPAPILDKIEEEIGELRAAFAIGAPSSISDELGDVIFALVNLGRQHGIEPEEALRGTNTKFRRRFAHIESRLQDDNVALEDAGLERMDGLWNDAKAIERALSGETATAAGK